MSATESPLTQLPPPLVIHQRMGRLYRELALLRRLLRLSQAVRETVTYGSHSDGREGVTHGR
jgi:hypothetical protein